MTPARIASGPCSTHTVRSPTWKASSAEASVPPNESRAKSRIAVSIPDTMSASWTAPGSAETCWREEPRLAVNQEHLLDTEHERAEQDDFGKRLPRAPGFEPPLQSLRGKALRQRLVQGLEHRGEGARDRLADRRAHDREEGIDEGLRIPPDGPHDGFLDRREEGVGQLRVFRRPERDGFREDPADVLGARFRVV